MPAQVIAPAPAPFNLAIIGGGISGVVLAAALAKRGIPCKLYERYHAFVEIGAGVDLSPNALRALKIAHPGIAAMCDQIATNNTWTDKSTRFYDWTDGYNHFKDSSEAWGDGKEMMPWLFSLDCDSDRHFVHRAEFLKEALKYVPRGTAQLNKRVEEIEEREDGSLLLKFKDGGSAEADAVIGTDGIRSKIRQLMFGEDNAVSHPTYTGKYAYRGMIPMERAIEELGEDNAVNAKIHMGKDGHILTFPVNKGATMNVVAFKHTDKPWTEPGLTASADIDEVIEDYKDWNQSSQRLISMLEPRLDRWAIFHTGDNPLPTYAKGRVCVMGDAAHATSPHHGAGAGMCIEDSMVMAELLQTVADSLVDIVGKRQVTRSQIGSTILHLDSRVSGESVQKVDPAGMKIIRQRLAAAFQAFDASRRERTQWLVNSSFFVGNMYELRNELYGDDLTKIAKEVAWRFSIIWDADVEAMNQNAKSYLKGSMDFARTFM